MKTYVLVDLENVSITNLDFMQKPDTELLVFIGKSQSRLSTDLAVAIQKLGTRANYVRMEGSGKNALDFHIAYFLGRLGEADAGASFVVISKDTGFDPLLSYLKAQGIDASRAIDTAALSSAAKPQKKPSLPALSPVEKAENHLLGLGKSRPARLKTLQSTLQALLGREKPLTGDEIQGIVAALQTRGLLEVNETKVTYRP